LGETTSYEPSCVKISSVVFPVENGKKKGKERKGTKSHAICIAPSKVVQMIFAVLED